MHQAIINTQEAADEKEFAKRQDRVLKRWKKLIVGLRIRQRLQASYHQEPKKVTPQEEESQVRSIRFPFFLVSMVADPLVPAKFGGSAPKPRKVVPPPPPPPRQEVQRPQTIKLIVTPSSKPAQPSVRKPPSHPLPSLSPALTLRNAGRHLSQTRRPSCSHPLRPSSQTNAAICYGRPSRASEESLARSSRTARSRHAWDGGEPLDVGEDFALHDVDGGGCWE